MCDIKRLVVGKITKPQGLKGEVRMHYYGNDPDALKHVKNARLIKSDGSAVDLLLERIRVNKNTFILKFKGIDHIDDTEDLLGSLVHINRAELTELEENEYYWEDLLGMRVYDETGELIGEIRNIFETGSNDVYVVKHRGKEILIPAIMDVIKKVDINEKKMHIHFLQGMRDDF
jgi:16S rRNA processing protein RimM